MNGWDEGALENIIENCEPPEEDGESSTPDGYNPPCNCHQFLTKKDSMLSSSSDSGSDGRAARGVCVDVCACVCALWAARSSGSARENRVQFS